MDTWRQWDGRERERSATDGTRRVLPLTGWVSEGWSGAQRLCARSFFFSAHFITSCLKKTNQPSKLSACTDGDTAPLVIIVGMQTHGGGAPFFHDGIAVRFLDVNCSCQNSARQRRNDATTQRCPGVKSVQSAGRLCKSWFPVSVLAGGTFFFFLSHISSFSAAFARHIFHPHHLSPISTSPCHLPYPPLVSLSCHP